MRDSNLRIHAENHQGAGYPSQGEGEYHHGPQPGEGQNTARERMQKESIRFDQEELADMHCVRLGQKKYLVSGIPTDPLFFKKGKKKKKKGAWFSDG